MILSGGGEWLCACDAPSPPAPPGAAPPRSRQVYALLLLWCRAQCLGSALAMRREGSGAGPGVRVLGGVEGIAPSIMLESSLC